MQVVSSREGSVTILKPLGSLITGELEDLEQSLQELTRNWTKRIAINMSNVNFVDSAGMELLCEFRQQLNEQGLRMKLYGLNEITVKIFDLTRLVHVTSEGPARMCGLYPRKGSVQIGADADLAVFDLQKDATITLEDQIALQWTLYEGLKAVYPETVLVRGSKVVDSGKLVGERGYGKYCSP